ncbi:MAG: hypothetical protein MSA15_12290 [Clostridium sp.]|nr:hypothetical protein [Clostridium sp.]
MAYTSFIQQKTITKKTYDVSTNTPIYSIDYEKIRKIFIDLGLNWNDGDKILFLNNNYNQNGIKFIYRESDNNRYMIFSVNPCIDNIIIGTNDLGSYNKRHPRNEIFYFDSEKKLLWDINIQYIKTKNSIIFGLYDTFLGQSLLNPQYSNFHLKNFNFAITNFKNINTNQIKKGFLFTNNTLHTYMGSSGDAIMPKEQRQYVFLEDERDLISIPTQNSNSNSIGSNKLCSLVPFSFLNPNDNNFYIAEDVYLNTPYIPNYSQFSDIITTDNNRYLSLAIPGFNYNKKDDAQYKNFMKFYIDITTAETA